MNATQYNGNGTKPPAPHSPIERLYYSPPLLLMAVVFCVFASEIAGTVVLHYFNLQNNPIHHILDSLAVVALLFPILYILVFRPVEHNLAQRRRAEEELITERNKLREILDAMPSSICIVNQSHAIEYANAAMIKEFGPAEGRSCFDYFHDRTVVCPDCRFAEVRAGKNGPWEWHSDKTGKTYEVFETPLRNADGTVARLSLMRNITARKQAADELRASRERLRSLSDHLQRAREEERAAVSREIHDELGQVLASVQLGVSSLAEGYQDHWHLSQKVAEMVNLIKEAIRTVQRISSQLRPTILDDLGLAEAVEWQRAEFVKLTGIACTCDILLHDATISKEAATAVFRICQEALTNIIRHAQATQVTITLEERRSRIVLIVRDNGRGISTEQLQAKGSLGLIGMRERAYMLGGRVRICRWLQHGTVVIAHIPITHQETLYND